ncbi:hypothetical protein JTB14_000493 [Gonioctena quinquepunctata]|nr:hypothetical protein JTB14_000493 [Gonioctena quinquepunctata]
MDKARSFETFWDQDVLQFSTINPGKAIAKMRFGEIFTPVWLKALTPAIPEAAFAPRRNRREPSLNSKAQQVTKDLFTTKPKLNSTKGDSKARSSTKKSKKESWFCFFCNTCSEEDMRLCVGCCQYVHETCVGLTEDDKEKFTCPQCS